MNKVVPVNELPKLKAPVSPQVSPKSSLEIPSMGGKVGRSGPPGNRNAVGNKGGAPLGNSNGVKHGASSFLKVLKLPPGARYIERRLSDLKSGLEREVIERNAEITIYSAAVIQSILRHEGRAQLLFRWMRLQDEKLPVLDKAKLLADISTATEKRDAAMRELGIHKHPEDSDPWADFDRDRTLPPADSHDPAAEAPTSEPAGPEASDTTVVPETQQAAAEGPSEASEATP